MKYGSGYVYPRKSKSGQTIWYIAYPDSSKKSGYKREAVSLSKREAGRVLAKRMEIVRNRYYGFTETNALYQEHFRKFLSLYQEGTETHKTYRGVLKTFVEFLETHYPAIQYLHQFNTMVFDSYAISRKKEGCKSWTVKNHLKVLKTVFRKAEEWELILKSPRINTGVRILDAKPIVMLNKNDDFSNFFVHCRKLKPDYYSFYFITARTGLRFREMISLEWDDVSLDEGFLTVRRHEGYNPKGRSKRTGLPKERHVPLTQDTKELFRHIPRDSNYKKVFLRNGKPISPKDKSFRRWLVTIAKDAGISGLTRLHELRHTFGQTLRDKGAHLDTIQKLMGHSDIRETQRYAGAPDADSMKAIDKLNGFGVQ